MFKFKDATELTNTEIRVYQEELKNYYEVVKKEILDRIGLLDKMDREWNKINTELSKRRNNYGE